MNNKIRNIIIIFLAIIVTTVTSIMLSNQVKSYTAWNDNFTLENCTSTTALARMILKKPSELMDSTAARIFSLNSKNSGARKRTSSSK